MTQELQRHIEDALGWVYGTPGEVFQRLWSGESCPLHEGTLMVAPLDVLAALSTIHDQPDQAFRSSSSLHPTEVAGFLENYTAPNIIGVFPAGGWGTHDELSLAETAANIEAVAQATPSYGCAALLVGAAALSSPAASRARAALLERALVVEVVRFPIIRWESPSAVEPRGALIILAGHGSELRGREGDLTTVSELHADSSEDFSRLLDSWFYDLNEPVGHYTLQVDLDVQTEWTYDSQKERAVEFWNRGSRHRESPRVEQEGRPHLNPEDRAHAELRAIERTLRELVMTSLAAEFGDHWWVEAVPGEIRERALASWTKAGERGERSTFLTLTDYLNVIHKHWGRFQQRVAPGVARGRWQTELQMQRLIELRNRDAHPARLDDDPFTNQDIEFLRELRSQLEVSARTLLSTQPLTAGEVRSEPEAEPP